MERRDELLHPLATFAVCHTGSERFEVSLPKAERRPSMGRRSVAGRRGEDVVTGRSLSRDLVAVITPIG
jgi:hypothetical protein